MDLGIFGSITLDAAFFSSLLSIVIIDLILAGDDAVVIAMASGVKPLMNTPRLYGRNMTGHSKALPHLFRVLSCRRR